MNCTALKELLEEFVRKNCVESEYPQELDELLTDTAKTGVVRFSWNLLKPLLKFRLESVFKSESLTRQVNKEKEDEELSKLLLQRLDLFDNPPFTIQRVCELVMDPRQHYKRRDKYMRAMEKNLMVVGTQEPDLTWMKSPRLTQLLEEKTGQLSNHTSVEHPTQSHLACSPEHGRAGMASPTDRERDQGGEPTQDQAEVMGRVLQEADSTTKDVCQSAEVEEGSVPRVVAAHAEMPQEVVEQMESQAPEAGEDRTGKGNSEHGRACTKSEAAEGAHEDSTREVAADETGQYISSENHSGAAAVVGGNNDGVPEDHSALSGATAGDVVGATREGRAVDNEVDGDSNYSGSSGEGKGNGMQEDRGDGSLLAATCAGKQAQKMVAEAGEKIGGEDVMDIRGSEVGDDRVQGKDGSLSECGLVPTLREGTAAHGDQAAETKGSRGADKATGEAKTTGVGVTAKNCASKVINASDSHERSGSEFGKELASSRAADDDSDNVCMETGEASTSEASEERKRNVLEEVHRGSCAEQQAKGGPAVGVSGTSGGSEDVSGLRVTDEEDWVVVEMGGAGAGTVSDKDPAAAGHKGHGDVMEVALTRSAKRPRQEDNEEREDEETVCEEEPATKQSRLEDSDENEVIRAMTEDNLVQQDVSRHDEEQDAERTDSTETTTDSSYKEAATGQVEKVEGNSDQAESS